MHEMILRNSKRADNFQMGDSEGFMGHSFPHYSIFGLAVGMFKW